MHTSYNRFVSISFIGILEKNKGKKCMKPTEEQHSLILQQRSYWTFILHALEILKRTWAYNRRVMTRLVNSLVSNRDTCWLMSHHHIFTLSGTSQSPFHCCSVAQVFHCMKRNKLHWGGWWKRTGCTVGGTFKNVSIGNSIGICDISLYLPQPSRAQYTAKEPPSEHVGCVQLKIITVSQFGM